MTVYVRTFQNQEDELLKAIANASSMPIQLVERARMIRHSAAGLTPKEIAAAVGRSVGCVRRWLKRFNAAGLLGLLDQPRSGRPREYTAEEALQVTEIWVLPIFVREYTVGREL